MKTEDLRGTCPYFRSESDREDKSMRFEMRNAVDATSLVGHRGSGELQSLSMIRRVSSPEGGRTLRMSARKFQVRAGGMRRWAKVLSSHIRADGLSVLRSPALPDPKARAASLRPPFPAPRLQRPHSSCETTTPLTSKAPLL